ncbi:MAG: acyl-CoA dehydratase activase [Thermodesulfovibrionales bacterium]|nr:acyl-CoA dehydratase activase [Thermodesulfovibrionales bacterium]
MRFIGLDAGSVSVKAVVIDAGGRKLADFYRKHSGHPIGVALEVLRACVSPPHGSSGSAHGFSLSVTGSAGRLIASLLGLEPVNEIVAQAYATGRLHPRIKSVIELGGEDSKLILLDKGVKDFSMNSVCAAGTGSFLDQQAERLRLSIEEFGEMALKSKKPPRIAGRCSVFAKSDMIHLQQIATPMEDIVAGLCFAVARNFKGTVSRGRQMTEPVSFQGGVAANKGMVRAFKEVFELKELFVPEDFALMGAWGAALKAMDRGLINSFDLKAIEEFLVRDSANAKGHRPLAETGDDFFERHGADTGVLYAPAAGGKTPAYMGIDIGSISTNLAVTDEDGRLLAKRYLMTAGRPIEAVRQGLDEIAQEVGGTTVIMGVGATGSGRYMIADFVGADIVKNEITAQATAAAFINKNVDTIFEIGGQDSKYISLRNGVIVDFEMNKACAAGTGSFLEEQAEKLGISIKDDFAGHAFSSSNPLRLGERCTVFMENSLMANLQRGAGKDDLLSGLSYSIVQNYINRVVAGKPIGENIFFQGGVAFNKAVVAAFEKYLGRPVTVPPHHDVTGAIGMALIAMRHMKEGRSPSTFKGFSLGKRQYSVKSFECRGCPNVCEINRVKIEGEEGSLLYGGRCEKYDIRRKRADNGLPDLFAFREERLRGCTAPAKGVTNPSVKEGAHSSKGVTIGLPGIFFFHDQLPYWVTLLESLGFNVEVSPNTNRAIISRGLESVLSEACFPQKVAHGHIAHLMDSNVDALFIPSFVNMNKGTDEFPKGASCPYAQTMPYVARVAFSGIKTVTPVINEALGKGYMAKELMRAFKQFRIGRREVQKAMEAAQKAQAEFEASIREKGRDALSGLAEGQRAVVIVGRAYNAFERGMNLEIPEKLAALGVLSIPMDFLPLEDMLISNDWPNMYWSSGQRILKAARFIAGHPNLYPIYIGNFSCGPDSFILKYFKKELRGKPFLHIEIDEHSADAGAITRCEAFLDSIGGGAHSAIKPAAAAKKRAASSSIRQKTVYIPRMSDHAFALQAAFERSGVPASVLPEPDKETTELGMKYVSGKECYPCAVTTGDMLRKVFSSDFRPDESAFFMPSGTGPCRFGQYNVFHRQVLEDIGFDNVPIFAPNQDIEFYRDLGMAGKNFPADSWKGIVAIELLYKCLHETRPYERQNGSADALYGEYLKRLYLSLRDHNGSLMPDDVLREAGREFEALPRHKERRPLIGVVGEIFVRSSRFSNEDLIRKIEALGGEAWLAPVEEWVYYVNHTARRRALLYKDFSAMINISLKMFFQKRIEQRYAACFSGFLKTAHEPSTKEILKKASPYVHDSFEGETVLSIGKSVDLAEKGAAGIINAMPFGCMPGTIVTALMRGISRQYGIPAINIPYDGTESSTVLIQLEAFMEQAKTRMGRKD